MTTTTGETQRARGRASLAAGTAVAAIACAIGLLVGAPTAGLLLGLGLVVANRAVQHVIELLAADASPTVQLGAHGFSMIGRALAVALTLFFVGASLSGTGSDQPIGLDRPELAGTALVIFFLGFTTDMAVEVLRRLGEHAATTPTSTDVTTTPEPAA